MNQLEQKTITTLEVAEMMETDHSKILRKLEGDKSVKGIIQILSEAKIGVADYFQESTYQDAQDKPRKCYLVTKLGCDFLANKFTGEKGILFTAKYVKKFADMEEIIKTQFTSLLDGLSPELQAIIMQDKKLQVVENRVDNLENTMNIDYAQQKKLRDFVGEVVKSALGGTNSKAYRYKDDNGKLSSKVFSRIWHDFYDYFNINAYANLPRIRFDEALEYINSWQPPTNMQLEIGRINRG
jgi:phage regulator Rha-like protein